MDFRTWLERHEEDNIESLLLSRLGLTRDGLTITVDQLGTRTREAIGDLGELAIDSKQFTQYLHRFPDDTIQDLADKIRSGYFNQG